jgi:alkyl hydroperoxide reductase subunit AhpC
MSIKLGATAPNFNAETSKGPINFHEYLGDSWGVLFSHPADFTPVCTTELGEVSHLQPAFRERNVKTIALSVDPISSHHDWIKDINDTQKTEVDYPIIADYDRKVAELYDMIAPEVTEKTTVRSVFVIGDDKKVKLTLTYPPSTGRNFEEILRVIDSLQLTAGYKVATPANWKQGEDVIISPSIDDATAEKLFPKGFNKVRDYLRYTPQPDI